jgi:hypothetical protein
MNNQTKYAIKEFRFWLEWSRVIFPMLLVIDLALIYFFNDGITLKIIACSIFSGFCVYLRSLFDILNKSVLEFFAVIGIFLLVIPASSSFNNSSDSICFIIMMVTFITSISGSHYINVKC